MTSRLVSWTGVDDATRIDRATVDLGADAMRAFGGSHCARFATSWELDVGPGWLTRSLCVTARGFGWSRSIHLLRSTGGVWSATSEQHGAVDLPAPGLEDPRALDVALDCDLGLCPVTNTMPIRRLGLLDREVGETDLVMAWVEVPSLRVIRSDQVYASALDDQGRRVRYTSHSRDFSAFLSVDDDALVIDYPGLARRA